MLLLQISPIFFKNISLITSKPIEYKYIYGENHYINLPTHTTTELAKLNIIVFDTIAHKRKIKLKSGASLIWHNENPNTLLDS